MADEMISDTQAFTSQTKGQKLVKFRLLVPSDIY